jgi:general secretion pathway protein G
MSHIKVRRRGDARSAFTLIELMIAVAVLGILSALGGTKYMRSVEKARIATAISDIHLISTKIESYKIEMKDPPANLDGVRLGGMRDPWGNPYGYLNIAGATTPVTGKVRKDRFLVPINSDFDLYSSGPDGDSKPPLTAKTSRDDIIRANDGGYIGAAAEY